VSRSGDVPQVADAPRASAEAQDSSAQVPPPSLAIDGAWWVRTQRLANNGSDSIPSLRIGLVKGILEGIDLSMMVGAASLADYKANRARALRSDITMDQLLTKIDGYYAEPSNLKTQLSFAVIEAMFPPKLK
jgi:hypothetical protein